MYLIFFNGIWWNQTIEDALGGATTLSTPQDQVEALIKQVAAENDLEITDKLVELEPGRATLAQGGPVSEEHAKEDQLARRFVTIQFVSFSDSVNNFSF